MILLDTNVVSEVMKRAPDRQVAGFITRTPLSDLFLPSLVLAELRYGLRRLPPGRRRDDLAASLEGFLESGFAGRVLVFDGRCAEAYADAHVARAQAGRPIQLQDALIGGMALAYGARFATRNLADFDGYGLTLIDPWAAA